MYVVAYKQYGRWCFTSPFERFSMMKQHIQWFLDRKEKDYITEIRWFELTPEWIDSLEKYEKQHL